MLECNSDVSGGSLVRIVCVVLPEPLCPPFENVGLQNRRVLHQAQLGNICHLLNDALQSPLLGSLLDLQEAMEGQSGLFRCCRL